MTSNESALAGNELPEVDVSPQADPPAAQSDPVVMQEVVPAAPTGDVETVERQPILAGDTAGPLAAQEMIDRAERMLVMADQLDPEFDGARIYALRASAQSWQELARTKSAVI